MNTCEKIVKSGEESIKIDLDGCTMTKYEKFDRAMYFVEISEGGTNNDPDDRGGKTKYGISEKQYPNVDIDNLTFEAARLIYYNDYWQRNRCSEMSTALAIVMFDSGVNCGVTSAAKWLQKSVNNLGDDIVVDGVIGPVTLTAINNYGHTKLAIGVLSYRLKRYIRLIDKNESQYKFIKGWISRVSNLMSYIL